MKFLAILLIASQPQWYVEIASSNFPPFKIAGGYSSEAQCKEDLPDIVEEWSAKTYPSGPKKGQNIFGTVTASCKIPTE